MSRDRSRHRAGVGRPGAVGRRSAAVPLARPTATAWLSPDTAPRRRRARSPRRSQRQRRGRRRPAGDSGCVRPGADRRARAAAPAAAHTARDRRLDVRAARLRTSRRRSTPRASRSIQDPHIGTGISNTVLVNWGTLAVSQVRQYHPNAVVVFIGANDGYSMPGSAASRSTAAAPSGRRSTPTGSAQMMNTYRQDGCGACLLADAADAARPAPGRGSRSSSTPRSRSPPSRGRTRCACSTSSRSSRPVTSIATR